jgi:LacI family transcriptional regulator
LILDHLWDLGHRSFAAIGYSSKDTWRWQGVVEWMESRGLRLDDCMQSFVLPSTRLESYEEGSELVEMVVRIPRRPTAILAVNDEMAAGAVKRLIELGYKVPGDISVVGFGNFAVGRFFSPALTTIDQQPQPMMRMAGEMLISQLGGKKLAEEIENIRLEPQLLVRDSTGPAPRV